MQVAVPFHGARWPQHCPCCGRRADSTLSLQQSRGVFLVVAAAETVLRIEVPYCSPCARHARAFRVATVGGMLYPATLVMFGGFVVGMIGLAAGMGRNAEMLMLFGPSVLATGLFIGYRLYMRARATVDARHVSAAPVLRVDSWTDDTIVLDCDSPSYAMAVRQANA